MLEILFINILIIFFTFYLIKKIIKNIYIRIIIVYFLVFTIITFFMYNKQFSVEFYWLNFTILTFVFTSYSWLCGIITKSVSLKILNLLVETNKAHKIENLTNKIVKKEFNKRIKILKKNNLVYQREGFYNINSNGIKKINFVLKLRKFFNIHKKNFYFTN